MGSCWLRRLACCRLTDRLNTEFVVVDEKNQHPSHSHFEQQKSRPSEATIFSNKLSFFCQSGWLPTSTRPPDLLSSWMMKVFCIDSGRKVMLPYSQMSSQPFLLRIYTPTIPLAFWAASIAKQKSCLPHIRSGSPGVMPCMPRGMPPRHNRGL